jgi:NAD(P)-dependent dehydrogenase (short-subunit alcohol dehydrogenase family)
MIGRVMTDALSGRRIALLGGTSGIGLAAARLALEAGASPIVVGRDQARLDAARRELGGVEAVSLDVSDDEAVRTFFVETGTLDHVFVTAGAPHYALLEEIDMEEARRAVADRATTMLSIARHGKGHVDPAGSLTFMGGTGARRPSPGLTVTGATLAAAESLVRGLALEIAPIRVNLIAAGFVDTELSARLLGDQLDARRDELRRSLPVRRVVQPEDVARLALHVMTNPAITGAVIDVDGGEQLV